MIRGVEHYKVQPRNNKISAKISPEKLLPLDTKEHLLSVRAELEKQLEDVDRRLHELELQEAIEKVETKIGTLQK